MTVSATSSSTRNDYTGNGSTVTYNFTFEALNETNSISGKNYSLKVILTESGVETEQTEDTDYTVTYNSDTRLGSITFTTAPTSSQTITLLSDLSVSQATDYINLGTDKFPADSHEATVDKLTLINREQNEKIDRSILLPESSGLTNVTIPVLVANASKFITVNGDGDDLTASEIADTVGSPVSTFMKTVLDDATAAAARATLDAEQKANSLTAITSLEDDDQFIVADNSDSDNSKKITLANMQGTTSLRGVSYLPNRITVANGTDSDHDIDFTAGNFSFYDGSGQATMTAKTGELDAAFGTGDGMLDTGTIDIDSTYNLFTVYNPATKDSKPLASLSDTSPTMTLPNADGYTILGERIAALLTDGSSNILNGTWRFFTGGYEFRHIEPIDDFSTTTPATTRTAQALSVPASVKAIFSAFVFDNDGSQVYVVITEEGGTDVAPSAANATVTADSGSPAANQVQFWTNSSSEIYYRADDASIMAFRLTTLGWIDYTL